MGEFIIDTPTGKKYRVQGPEGATQQQAEQRLRSKHPELFSQDMQAGVEKLERQGLPPDFGQRQKALAANVLYGATAKPVLGAAELAGHLVPGQLGESMIEAEGQLQKGAEGLVGPQIPEAQALGEAASPLNWGPGRLIKGAGTAANIGRGALTGGFAGAFTPTSKTQPFDVEKPMQIGEGTLAGGATAGISKGLGAIAKGTGNIAGRQMTSKTLDLRDRAANMIKERLQDDAKGSGTKLKDAFDYVEKRRQQGKPAGLADVPDLESTRRLLGNIYRAPGPARAQIRSELVGRDQEAGQRLSDDISAHLNAGLSTHAITERLYTTRSNAARPLYKAALDPKIVADSPLIQKILADPTVARGIGPGLESQRLEALGLGQPYEPVSAQFLVLDPTGVPIGIRGAPNMQVLDAVKRGLDNGIDAQRDSITGRLSQQGVMLDRVRKLFVEELDNLNPAYKAARDAWAGPSQSLDAVTMGRTMFERSPDEITDEFQQLGPSQQEFWRLGAADMLRERLDKTSLTGDEARSILKNSWTRRQLAPIFRSPADYDEFADRVAGEREMWSTQNTVMRGSQTAERQAEDASGVAIKTAETAHKFFSGHWLSGTKDIIDRWRQGTNDPELNQEVAKMLLAPLPKRGALKQRLSGKYAPPTARVWGDRTQQLLSGGGSVLAPAAGALVADPDVLEGVP